MSAWRGGVAGVAVALLGGACAPSATAPVMAPASSSGSDAAAAPADGGNEAAAADGSGEAPQPVPAPVVISELMYHPVLETTEDDLHEFVEIANRTEREVDLSGWQ